jgi:hypothetical protein
MGTDGSRSLERPNQKRNTSHSSVCCPKVTGISKLNDEMDVPLVISAFFWGAANSIFIVANQPHTPGG